MKKIIALALALIMVLGLATTVSADEPTGFTIHLNGTTQKPTAGHTYTVYQIFVGDLEKLGDGQVMTNIKYGTGYGTAGAEVTAADLAAITDARAFADDLIENSKLNASYGELNEGNSWTLQNVPAGYYLIVDSTLELPDGHTRSSYIVEVVDDVDVNPKSTVVDVQKKVKDINDSVDADMSAWQDSADYDIKDTVPYQIVSKIDDIALFKTYRVAFNDVMSKGLTYNEDAKVTLAYTVEKDGTTTNGTMDVTTSFPLTSAAYAGDETKYVGGTVYTFTCTDLKALVANEGNLVKATITIDYTCTLNENAVVGEAGNPNMVNVEYDREPDDDQPEINPGKTPWDVCIVFTFKTDVKKVHQTGVDAEGKPIYAELTGAEFKLEKYDLKTNSWKEITVVKNDAGTVFSFNGLDDGKYRIVETKAPDGYNKIDDIYFTVTATHDVVAADPKLNTLEATATKPDGSAYTDEEIATGKVATFTVDKTEGQVATEVVNEAGVELPETGGMGTTLFYIIGGLLVAGAAILLITKKRMSANY